MGTSDGTQFSTGEKAGENASPRGGSLSGDSGPRLGTRTPLLSLREIIISGLVLLSAGAILICSKESPVSAVAVAPLFIHGEGFGVVSPRAPNGSAFMRDGDALEIIRLQLEESGIRVRPNVDPIPGVLIVSYEEDDDAFFLTRLFRKSPVPGWYEVHDPFVPDLRDSKRNVAVEYTGIGEYRWLEDRGDTAGMIIHFYNPRSVAQNLRQQVREEGVGSLYFGVFYDPLTRRGPNTETASGGGSEPAKERSFDEAREESKRLLVEQVKDFAEWLKTQRVIDEPRREKSESSS